MGKFMLLLTDNRCFWQPFHAEGFHYWFSFNYEERARIKPLRLRIPQHTKWIKHIPRSPTFDFHLVSILQRGSEYSKTIHYSFSHLSTVAVIPLCCATKQTHLSYVMKANFPTLRPRIQQLERVHRLEARLIKKAFDHLDSSLWNADASDLTSSWPSRFWEL